MLTLTGREECVHFINRSSISCAIYIHLLKKISSLSGHVSHLLKSWCRSQGHLFSLTGHLFFIQQILCGNSQGVTNVATGIVLNPFHVRPLGLDKWWFVFEFTSLFAAQCVWARPPFGYLTNTGSQKGFWHTWQTFLSERTMGLPFSFTYKHRKQAKVLLQISTWTKINGGLLQKKKTQKGRIKCIVKSLRRHPSKMPTH